MGPFLCLVVFRRTGRGYQSGTNFELGEGRALFSDRLGLRLCFG